MMLLRNINTAQGHCNGTRYIVDGMSTQHNVLYLRVACGPYKGRRLCLPRIPCEPGDDKFPVPGFQRLQFPIRVCFAITTNKGQGQSFGGRVAIDLTDECFAHGQLYVALSRTTHPGNVAVLTKTADERVKNPVFYDALS